MKRRLLASACLVASLAACATHGGGVDGASGGRARWCTAGTPGIDSVFVVAKAEEALRTPGTRHERFQPISLTRVPEGFVVRLVLVDPPGFLGGGGVVWVDGETGCPIVLVRYE